MKPQRTVRGRLDELVALHGLPLSFAPQVEVILDALQTEEASVTTVRDPAEGVEIHVVDALDGLALDLVRAATTLADLGAGAGFPGLVLASALPEATVHLVESVGRKCAFMDRAAALAGLDNAIVVQARAEEWRDGMGRCDVVTARALAPLGVLVEYAAPLLRDGGHLVAWKAQRDPAEERDGSAAADVVGLRLEEVVRVEPRPGAEHRHLHVFTKVAPTPERFPRRAGMARKRPLRATG